MRWFALLHIILFALYAIILILLHAGRSIINNRSEEVKEKTEQLKDLEGDAASLMRRFPECEALKRVVEALRYSTPGTHSSLSIYDDKIQSLLIDMGSGQNLESNCEELLRLIADRNARAKRDKSNRTV
jgi:hypothetical protein